MQNLLWNRSTCSAGFIKRRTSDQHQGLQIFCDDAVSSSFWRL